METKTIKADWRHLLGIYAILPVLGLLILADRHFFGLALQKAMPTDPDNWAVFRHFFILPHIIASILLFAD